MFAKDIDETDTPEQCQILCNADDRCNWFSWSDNFFPKGCWLLSKNGVTKRSNLGRDKGANGPKNCPGK